MIPLLREKVGQALTAAKPLLHQVAERIRQKQTYARQERELEPIRVRLLRERMTGWHRAQERGMASDETASVAERRIRQEITAMSAVELRRVAATWQREEADLRHRQAQDAARQTQSKGPSLSM